MSPAKISFQISGLTRGADKIIGDVLRGLPEYFSYEPMIEQYCADALLPEAVNFAAVDRQGSYLGCSVAKVINENTVELLVIGVRKSAQNSGVGTALVSAVLKWTAANRRSFVTLRTVGPSQNNPDDTRVFRFFQKCGFIMMDEYDFLWEDYTCALMVQKV